MKKRFTALFLALALCVGLTAPAFALGGFTVTGTAVGERTTFSIGYTHTAAIDTNGALWMWGENDLGQLGNGTLTDSYVPVKVLDNVASVCCGGRITAAIKKDGSLWMWGDNGYGQLGNGRPYNAALDLYVSPKPVKVMDNVASVICLRDTTAAIKTDGSLWMWGDNDRSQLGFRPADSLIATRPVKVMDNVASVSCDGSTTAAVKKDGTLWMWGLNNFGRLGNGTLTDSYVPVKVLDNVASVFLNYDISAAIKKDGSLWTWGYNKRGQLGNGTQTSSSVPGKILDDVAAVNDSAAIKKDGTLWQWGPFTHNGESMESSTPVKTMDGVSAAFTENPYAVIKSDHTLWLWGDNEYGQVGNNKQGTLEGEPFQALIQLTPVKIMDNVAFPTSAVTPSTPTPAGFGDVPAGVWYTDAVEWAVSKGITNGTEKGKFSPTQNCTHAQILTFLYRANRGGGAASAQDMDLAVQWAREKGMIDGGFNGSAFCTRADAVNYIWQAFGRQSAKASSFTDVPANAAYAKAVDWAVANGVTNGDNAAQTEFSPNKVCTRGHIVTFLHRAYVPEARLK